MAAEPVVFPPAEELKKLQSRIFRLLEATPPGGEDLAATLRTLFCASREDYWMRWKQDHCPSFEKGPLDVAALATEPATKKRKLPAASSAASRREESYFFEHSLESAQVFAPPLSPSSPVQRAVKVLSSKVPSFETHIAVSPSLPPSLPSSFPAGLPRG
jgi:hypothetical protein